MADLPLGQVCYLEIALPSAPAPRALRGQIKNRSHFSYGFQFMEPDERAIAMLRPFFKPGALMVPAPEGAAGQSPITQPRR